MTDHTGTISAMGARLLKDSKYLAQDAAAPHAHAENLEARSKALKREAECLDDLWKKM